MTVRHWTGSANVTGLLNRLGHSVSSSYVLQHDTVLANKQPRRKTLTPEDFDKIQIHHSCIWQLISRKKLSGTGTIQCSSGIIIQQQTDCDACVPDADVGECLPQTTEKTRKAKSRQTRTATLSKVYQCMLHPREKVQLHQCILLILPLSSGRTSRWVVLL